MKPGNLEYIHAKLDRTKSVLAVLLAYCAFVICAQGAITFEFNMMGGGLKGQLVAEDIGHGSYFITSGALEVTQTSLPSDVILGSYELLPVPQPGALAGCGLTATGYIDNIITYPADFPLTLNGICFISVGTDPGGHKVLMAFYGERSWTYNGLNGTITGPLDHNFTITPTDMQPPTILCPTVKISSSDSDSCSAVVDFAQEVTAQDESGIRSLTCEPPSGSRFDVGCTVVNVTAIDNRNNVASAQFTVVVRDDTPPAIQRIEGPSDPVAVGALISITAEGADNCSVGSARWIWDDGQESTDGLQSSGSAWSATGQHAYSNPGVYTARLVVTDATGNLSVRDWEYVVVFDPTGGFVTGAGQISTGPGSYALDPHLTGRASFGFVARYLKGANIPTGNTQFQFQTADLKFKSSEYQWLVVSGARAQFKGWGTINSEGNYGFILTAIDGEVNGRSEPDHFRIKIWDTATEVVIYDNQSGTSDSSELGDATVVQAGSIAVHRR